MWTEGSRIVTVFCGIDWAEAPPAVALVDRDGTLIAKRRISDDDAGFTMLLQLLAEAGDNPGEPIPVVIETSRGLLVAALRSTSRRAVAIQPKPVFLFRYPHSPAPH